MAEDVVLHSITGLHELDDSATIRGIGKYTDDWIEINAKYVRKYKTLRRSTLWLVGTRALEIDWNAQGLRNRLVVLGLEDRHKKLTSNDYEAMTSPRAARYIRAFVLANLARLIDDFPTNTAIKWRHDDREKNEGLEDDIIKDGILTGESQFVRRALAYGGTIKHGELAGVLSNRGLSLKKAGAILRLAFFEREYEGLFDSPQPGEKGSEWPCHRTTG